jgi:serine/threonine-protein kinase HipA
MACFHIYSVYTGFVHRFYTGFYGASPVGSRGQYQDGAGAKTGVSYLELADLIGMIGESVNEDLEELWKRIVFSICIRNTDDHLRNHIFLLGTGGWRLSPVYDINPQPWGTGLALNINETNNRFDLDVAVDVAEYYFRLTTTPRSLT